MLTCQRDKFRIPDAVSYLNCAYFSPLLIHLEAIGHQAVSQKLQPWEIGVTDFFEPLERVKALFAQLVNISDPQRVALVPSVSYGMANVVNNVSLDRSSNVVLIGEQFPSNVYPWQEAAKQAGAEVRIVPPPEAGPHRGQRWNEAILSALDGHTRAVSMGHVHWADGTLFDLETVGQRARDLGALLIVDGTQSVGALPFDVQAIQPDALVCAGYKWLLGPYSLGLAYYGPRFDGGRSIEHNWITREDSDNFPQLVNYRDTYREKAYRYTMGECSNFFLLPVLIGALEQLLDWGVANIQGYCRELCHPHLEALTQLGCQLESDAHRAAHLFGIRLPDHWDGAQLAARLKEEQVYVSLRGNAVRVAPHVYNTSTDLERLVEVFREAVRQQAT